MGSDHPGLTDASPVRPVPAPSVCPACNGDGVREIGFSRRLAICPDCRCPVCGRHGPGLCEGCGDMVFTETDTRFRRVSA